MPGAVPAPRASFAIARHNSLRLASTSCCSGRIPLQRRRVAAHEIHGSAACEPLAHALQFFRRELGKYAPTAKATQAPQPLMEIST